MAVCRVSWGVRAGRGGRGAQVEVAAFSGGRGRAALLRWHVLAAGRGGRGVGVRVWIEVHVVLIAFPAAGGIVTVTHVCAAGGGGRRDPSHQIWPVEGKYSDISNLRRHVSYISISTVIYSAILYPSLQLCIFPFIYPHTYLNILDIWAIYLPQIF